MTEMIRIRPAAERGIADFGWLDSRHTFSFGNYHDSEQPFWDFAEIALALADAVLAEGTD